MPGPSIPTNFVVQQANGSVFLTWNISTGSINYPIQRSTDGVSFTFLAAPSVTNYLDSTVTVGVTYYYRVAASDNSGTSEYTRAQSIVPAGSADLSLGQIRLMAQQRADMVNSDFVSTSEWNSYITQSYFELYDLLVTAYEDYFVASPYQFQTDGSSNQYTLPSNFYKLMGVDLGLAPSGNAWVTLKKFNFISRNRYVFPQLGNSYLGVNNLRYRLVGNTIEFIPTPSSGQFIRVWFVPKLTQPVKDSDILSGVSGWLEYVIVDAAIKALQKEESDTTILMLQKQALKRRIEESSVNRDQGEPDTISDIKTFSERFGGYGAPNGDGPYGGY